MRESGSPPSGWIPAFAGKTAEARNSVPLARPVAAVLAVLLLTFLVAIPRLAAQELSGYAESKGWVFFSSASPRDPDAILWGNLFLRERVALGPVRLDASLRFERISSAEEGPMEFDPADRNFRRSPLSIRELSLRLPVASGIDFQFGRFSLGWGRTDGYSPADAFLPRDASDPFSDEKIPVWGARLSGQRGAIRAELVGAATTTPWRLPVLSGRYAPLPVEGVVLVDGSGTPPRPGWGALRLHGSFDDWEIGLWARGGVRPAPLLVFRIDQAHPAPDGFELPVDRRWARESAAGVEIERVVGGWVVRGEVAALESDDPGLGHALIGSAGFERSFGDGTLLVTVAGNARGTPVPAALLLDRAILPAAIAAWNRTEEWGSWKLVATVGLRRGDGLFKAEAEAALTDEWSGGAGLDLPWGSERGPFGALDGARRLRVSVRRSW